MKSTILISSYLWTDTFKRWREQFSSPSARFLVGVLMSMSGFLAIGMLNSAEDKIIYELEAMGSNRSRITATVLPGQKLYKMPYLDGHGQAFSYSLIPIQATSELRSTMQVVAMNDTDYERLVRRFPTIDITKPLVVDNSLRSVEFNNLKVRVQDHEMTAQILSDAPDELYAILPNSIVVAHSAFPEFRALAHQRIFVVESTAGAQLKQTFDSWLILEHLDVSQFSYTDASLLLAKLERFKTTKRLALIGLSSVVGLLVVAVFAACSILEFKQSIFVVTLMRSFGIPSLLLFMQRLFENLFLLTASFGVGLGIALLLAVSKLPIHYWLLYNDRGIDSMLIVALSGVIAAIMATVPVLFSLRTEPGRLLK